jgi:hypothetical protein
MSNSTNAIVLISTILLACSGQKAAAALVGSPLGLHGVIEHLRVAAPTPARMDFSLPPTTYWA